MAVTRGSARFGLWWVQVEWDGNRVLRARFSTVPGEAGPVPPALVRYLAGEPVDLRVLATPAAEGPGVYPAVWREVREIPYGETATYGEIAERAGTGPRVVGTAMARNPVPLVIPCHRVVSSRGLGGFSPSVEIKRDLLAMEARARKKAGAGTTF